MPELFFLKIPLQDPVKKMLYFKASEDLSFVKEGMPFSVFAKQQIAVGRHRPDFTVSDLF